MEIELTRGAFNLLTHLLSEPGWCTDVQHFYVAGKFVTEMPEQPLPPKDKVEQQRFVGEPVKLELSEKQLEIFQHCVHTSLKRGALGVNSHTLNLVEVLKIGR